MVPDIQSFQSNASAFRVLQEASVVAMALLEQVLNLY